MYSKTGKLTLRILSISLLSAFLAGLGYSQPREKLPAPELRSEISLLNLLNGLDLTPAQTTLLLAKAEEAKKLEDRWQAETQSRRAEMESVLSEIKTYVSQKKELPEELVLRFRRVDDELKSVRSEIEKSKRELAGEVKASLESQQIYQFERFIPCIIPPKGESRVGQAEDPSGLARRLERIRTLPERAYLFRREEICRTVLAGFQKRFPLAAFEEEASLEGVGRVLDRCRSLSVAEFELQKNGLAEELVSLFKPEFRFGDITKKIETFLLSEEVIPLLRERLTS
jgi:hypothetical protein